MRKPDAADHRILARARFGLAVALFIYLGAFLLLVGNQTQDEVSGAGLTATRMQTFYSFPFWCSRN